MPFIGGRFYSNFGHYSPYQSMVIQRYRMREANDRVTSSFADFSSTFSDAAVSQAQGLSNIAAQRALDRIKAETQAKLAENSASNSSGSDTLVPPPKNSVFSTESSTTLDGGSQIDLKSNTLTLPDGTKIDLTTGLEKVDVTA